MQIKGAITALITPFKEGLLDEEALEEHVDFQVREGIDGLLTLGTTGEMMTLSESERERVVGICRNQKRVPLIVNVGTNSTAESIERAKKAKVMGADALLVVTPYYNKPSQAGLIAHFHAVAESTDLPILVYHIPGRTGVRADFETLQSICSHSNVVGVKESSGDLVLASKLTRVTQVFSGDDPLILPMMSVGAKGCVSVISNLRPNTVVRLTRAMLEGDCLRAEHLHYDLLPEIEAIFQETNPMGIKAAMKMLGMRAGDVRLPLVPMDGEALERLEKVLCVSVS